MLAYALATLRDMLKRPALWLLLATGMVTAAMSTKLGILAIGEDADRLAELAAGTGHLFGALAALWALGLSIEEDQSCGFRVAADASGPGPAGRLMGRWLGACILGVGLACLTGICGLLLTGVGPAAMTQFVVYLLITSIMGVAIVGAWVVWLGARGAGAAAALGTLILWMLGHLPWASAAWIGGAAGHALGAWLPGPRSEVNLATAGYTATAVLGLLLLTLARARSSWN